MSKEAFVSGDNMNFPFFHNLIPVAKGLDGFRLFTEQYKGFHFCPYLADKTNEEWEVSTSRQYMNRVLANFLYVPVNIEAGNETELINLIEYADSAPEIAAVNITKPHKSTPLLRKYYFGDRESTKNIDTLIKSGDSGKLHPYDLNAPAFVNWFEDYVQPFKGTHVIIVGVGGVGEPVAKHIDAQNPDSITLVDINDRNELATSLSSEAVYYSLLSEVPDSVGEVVLINASGKDGVSDDTGLLTFITTTEPGIFVDLRPHLTLPIVKEAAKNGWQEYTGHGMNARNDYELLNGIFDYLDTPSGDRLGFDEFSALVAVSS